MMKRKLSILAAYIEFYIMGIIDKSELEAKKQGK